MPTKLLTLLVALLLAPLSAEPAEAPAGGAAERPVAHLVRGAPAPGCPEDTDCCGPPAIHVFLSATSLSIAEEHDDDAIERQPGETAHAYLERTLTKLKQERPERIEVRVYTDDDVRMEQLWEVVEAMDAPCGPEGGPGGFCLLAQLLQPRQLDPWALPRAFELRGPRVDRVPWGW